MLVLSRLIVNDLVTIKPFFHWKRKTFAQQTDAMFLQMLKVHTCPKEEERDKRNKNFLFQIFFSTFQVWNLRPVPEVQTGSRTFRVLAGRVHRDGTRRHRDTLIEIFQSKSFNRDGLIETLYSLLYITFCFNLKHHYWYFKSIIKLK